MELEYSGQRVSGELYHAIVMTTGLNLGSRRLTAFIRGWLSVDNSTVSVEVCLRTEPFLCVDQQITFSDIACQESKKDIIKYLQYAPKG